MRPHSDADAPSLDCGVETRLRALDPNLLATWSKFAIDPFSGQPIVGPRGPVEAPGWYLWRKDDYADTYHFVLSLPRFGYREIKKLENDVGRYMDPGEIAKRHAERYQARQEADLKARREERDVMLRANKRRIGDLVYENKLGRRQAKIFSGGGIKSRGTPGEVMKDAREDGWELPDNN